MKKFYYLIIILLATVFSGCLIFNKISYKVITEGRSGSAEVIFHDIRSDASSPTEFDSDKDYLFNYIWKSDQFIADMKKEGKEITERELFLSNDTLVGRIVFNFDEITNVENLVLEDDFFFLTLPLEDSVVTTNGEIIISQQYKRILWDASFDELTFEILGHSFEEERYRPLGYHFKQIK
jgi:hypothetical protein